MSKKTKYGIEHLKFGRNTYRTRNSLLITCVLSILYFEYKVADDLEIYSVIIPKSLVELSLYVTLLWLGIQFLFLALDDYLDWKKAYMISERPIFDGMYDKQPTLLFEIESFSKGKIEYRSNFGGNFSGNIKEKTVLDSVDRSVVILEKQIKYEVKCLQKYQKWYKNYSIITLLRFSLLEFTLPLLFALYAGLICHFLPILPK